jgi:hypothetical protein
MYIMYIMIITIIAIIMIIITTSPLLLPALNIVMMGTDYQHYYSCN